MSFLTRVTMEPIAVLILSKVLFITGSCDVLKIYFPASNDEAASGGTGLSGLCPKIPVLALKTQ